jgi:uncharacterized protein involved in outer membrane biogenesis
MREVERARQNMAASTARSHLWPVGFGGLVVPIVLLILLWDWNWFRPLVEARVSAAAGRTITIGHFDVRPARSPLLVFDNVSVANPEGFPDNKPMGTIGRLSVRFDLNSMFHGPVQILEIAIEHPDFTLAQGPSGKPNWSFGAGKPADQGKPAAAPQIGTLTISAGTAHVIYGNPQADFTLTIETRPPAAGGEPTLVVGAKGTYAKQPINGHFVGGSLLSLRDPARPYPVDLSLANGATRIALKGTVERPMEMGGADLDLDLRGKDLADLYPLTNIPLAPTPAYHLSGKLGYAQSKILLRQVTGTVGSSDIGGEIALAPRDGRPLVTGTLTSHKVVLADLAGFIGSAPGRAGTKSDTHKAERARQEASPKLLPDTPINLPKLRAADIELTYRGERIESESTPLDNLEVAASIENGRIAVKPLIFGVGEGQIAADLTLAADGPLVHLVGDVDFRRVDVSRIMHSTKIFKGAGTIGGQAKIDTVGNSLAAMLGQANGDIKLFMAGGDISALLVDLAGLDFANSALSALGLPQRAPVRCLVFDAGLTKGDLQSRMLLIDTTEANVVGKGHVDLAQEQVDMQLSTEPKHFSIGAFSAPIDIKGALKSPSIGPEPGVLTARGTASGVLGVLLTPLGALIPTIQLGLGEDNDCNSLLQDAERGARKPAPPRSGKPTMEKKRTPAALDHPGRG